MIWLIYILLDSFLNWYFIVKKKTIPIYAMLFCIRVGAAISYGGLFWKLHYGQWVETFKCVGFVAFTFPFLFNTTLSTFRKLDLDYAGAESGWIDEYVVKHGVQRQYYWATFILFIIAIKYFI